MCGCLFYKNNKKNKKRIDTMQNKKYNTIKRRDEW